MYNPKQERVFWSIYMHALKKNHTNFYQRKSSYKRTLFFHHSSDNPLNSAMAFIPCIHFINLFCLYIYIYYLLSSCWELKNPLEKEVFFWYISLLFTQWCFVSLLPELYLGLEWFRGWSNGLGFSIVFVPLCDSEHNGIKQHGHMELRVA